MLYRVPPLTSEDRRVLEEIQAMRHRLRDHLRDAPQWAGQLRRNLTARAIVGSNTIAGHATTVDDVEALLSGEDPLEAEGATRAEVAGYQQGTAYMQALADAAAGFRYDVGLLNGLHFMLQGHRRARRPGRWRAGPAHVAGTDDPAVAAYTAPAADDIPALADELVAWLNEGDLDAPVHVRAAMAHLNLVNIHPWSTGNGRMARALSTLVFAREASIPPEFSSIEEWLGRGQNTYAYYQVLQTVGGTQWSPCRDTHPWITFCLGAHHRQAQQAERRLDLLGRAWTRLTDEVDRYGLDARVVHALLPTLWDSRVRRPVYQHDAGLSDQQAIRDIRELVRLGWLEPHGRARTRYYAPGPSMAPVQQDVRQSTAPYAVPYGART